MPENVLNLKEKQIDPADQDAGNVEKKAEPGKEERKKGSIEWSAPEFEYYRKNRSWFATVGVIAAGLFIWAVFSKNLIFAFLIILSCFSVIAFALKRPNYLNLAITPKGIKINKTLYAFDNLRSFWIFYQPPLVRELSVRSQKTIMPYIKIPLGEQNPVEIRRFLLKYLPEKKHKESLIDNLARQLKF